MLKLELTRRKVEEAEYAMQLVDNLLYIKTQEKSDKQVINGLLWVVKQIRTGMKDLKNDVRVEIRRTANKKFERAADDLLNHMSDEQLSSIDPNTVDVSAQLNIF